MLLLLAVAAGVLMCCCCCCCCCRCCCCRAVAHVARCCCCCCSAACAALLLFPFCVALVVPFCCVIVVVFRWLLPARLLCFCFVVLLCTAKNFNFNFNLHLQWQRERKIETERETERGKSASRYIFDLANGLFFYFICYLTLFRLQREKKYIKRAQRRLPHRCRCRAACILNTDRERAAECAVVKESNWMWLRVRVFMCYINNKLQLRWRTFALTAR